MLIQESADALPRPSPKGACRYGTVVAYTPEPETNDPSRSLLPSANRRLAVEQGMTLQRMRLKLLGISPAEAEIDRRGFRPVDAAVAEHLERVGRAFLTGYNTALGAPSPAQLGMKLDGACASDYRGFAFEGAAMALTVTDAIYLTRGAFREFLRGPGAPHAYMLHVGAGWAIARLPWLRFRLSTVLTSFDPLLRWLVADGFGFHEGYFHWPASIRRQVVPRGVRGYAARAFDQGLGRSLWFVDGSDPSRIAASILAFPPHRRDDLWAGVGLACAYAGGGSQSVVARVAQLAGEHAPAAAQGAAFAAEARSRAGNPIAHCEEASQVFWGRSADATAAIAQETMVDLPFSETTPAYEVWRRRVQHDYSSRLIRST